MNKIAKATILVTGGAGFIGSHLIEQLLILKPKKIYILDNLYRGKIKNIAHLFSNPYIEFIKGDIRNASLVNRIMSKSDYCFHLASMSLNACAAYIKQAFDVMVSGTFNIIQSAQKYKIKKLIYSSSASIYGMADHYPTAETHHPYDNKTFYGAAKLFGEQLLRTYYYIYGLKYIALRYFNVYGVRMDTRGKYTAVFIKWLDCIKSGSQPTIYGNGLTTMDFIYVTDVVKANILALESNISDEIFNIGSGEETGLKKLLRLILKINHRPKQNPKYILTKIVNTVQRRQADISKAEKMLKFRPQVSLKEGLIRLCDWYFNKEENDKHH
ncbi:MAG: NAD-dependent epimerase/dehydratase [uncultured bacterium]|nr:MAG: NAD-dependent epimerase/dehydratase [uncultured bacterium]